jgi:heme A synthase
MKTAVLLTAAVLIVLGVLFTLQGIGLVGGSVKTGDRTWAVIGPVLAVIGVVLGGWALRRRAGQG